MAIFSQSPMQVPACTLSDNHTPVVSSISCAPIVCRVVSLPDEGLYYSLQGSMPPTGQGLDWSLEGPENYFCSDPNTLVISQSYKRVCSHQKAGHLE